MTTLPLILLILYGAIFLIQMVYYWYLFSSLAFYRNPESGKAGQPPVSIVIAARDEYHNLVKYLPEILSQDYPNFEVVVVNHASNDESAEYLEELSRNEPRLNVVNIKQELNFFTGKKFPLSLGIKSAKHEILLLTDADCKPSGPKWIAAMVQQYSGSTEIVLGYSPYTKRPGFLNLLVRYDTFITAMQYLSYALRGLPYMGVGRNLSYKRTVFYRNKGFTSHYKVASGDDDLFINQAATSRNTAICINPESFMYSRPAGSFRSWFNQKRRHLTTGKLYKTRFKFLLGLYGFSQLLFYVFFVLLLTLKIFPLEVVGVFLLRLASLFVVHKKTLKQLREDHLLLFSLAWEPFHLLTLQLIALGSLFRKTVKWK